MADFRVGKPRAKLTLSPAGLTIGSGDVLIPWSAVEHEDPLGFVPEPPVTLVTIPIPGLYLIAVNVQRGVSTTNSVLSVRLQRNGLNIARSLTSPVTTALAGGVTAVELLAEGDTIGVAVQAATGASSTSTLNALSYLALCRIGPQRWR